MSLQAGPGEVDSGPPFDVNLRYTTVIVIIIIQLRQTTWDYFLGGNSEQNRVVCFFVFFTLMNLKSCV